MRIYEITNPEDQLALLKMITDNTWAAISRQPKTKVPITKAASVTPIRKPVKTKAITSLKKRLMPQPQNHCQNLSPLPHLQYK